MKASEAQKQTIKGKKEAAKVQEDKRLAKEQEVEKGRAHARKNFDKSYAEVMEQIQGACDGGRVSTIYHATIYTEGYGFNYASGEERVSLIEDRLKEDGYEVVVARQSTRIQANEGQDDPAIDIRMEISW